MIIPNVPVSSDYIGLELVDLTSGNSAAVISSIAASGWVSDIYTTINAPSGGGTCKNPLLVKSSYGDNSDGFEIQFYNPIQNDFRIKINGEPVQDDRRNLQNAANVYYRYYGKVKDNDLIEVDMVSLGLSPTGTGSFFQIVVFDGNEGGAYVANDGNTGTFPYQYGSGVGTGLYAQGPTFYNLASFNLTLFPLYPSGSPFYLVEKLDGSIVQTNQGWATSLDANLMTGTPFPPQGDDSAIYERLASDHPYQFSAQTNYRSVTTFNRLLGSPYELESGVVSDESAWVSYDLSGVNTKKVFAYSVTMLDNLSGSGNDPFRIEGLAPVLSVWSPENNSSYCSALALKQALTGCEGAKPQEEPDQVCLTGVVTQEALKAAIDAARKAAGLKTGVGGAYGSDADEIDNSIISYFQIYTGGFTFNVPATGDYLAFDSAPNYPANYVDIYHQSPPYPKLSTGWAYGVDYTGIDDLVFKINQSLSGQNYNVWQNIECLKTEGSGFFENGPLAYATKSGDNFIALRSAQIGEAGHYQWTFTSGNRDVRNQVPILKYLLPTTVKLQGANVYGIWTDIDAHSGVDWLSIPPTVVTQVIPSPISSGNAPQTQDKPQQPEIAISGEAEKQLIYTLTITGNDKCEVPFKYVTEFYQTPSASGCKNPNDEEDEKEQEELDQLANPQIPPTLVSASYLKTGWKFNNPQDYNYYRVVLDDFSSQSAGLKPTFSKSFTMSNVNFYGVQTGLDPFSGSMCILGAKYTGYVEGYATGTISGSITGTADEHGVVSFRQIVKGVPNNGGMVKFNKKYGQPVEDFSGLLRASLTGTGYYTENVGGYFYETGSQTISFSKPVSGFISGSGNLTGGPYYILNAQGIASITGSQFVAGTKIGMASGIIPNYYAVFENVPGFGYLNGTLTGNVGTGDNGQYNFNQVISGVPVQAYSFILSGEKRASAVLSYGSPVEGNTVSINDILAIYSTGSGNFAPTYYNSISSLAAIINSGSSSYGVSASVSGSNIYLQANSVGDSGNGIALAASGASSFGSSATTGGQTYYYPLTPSNLYTGLVQQTVFATGTYTGWVSGYITGTIKQLDFVRSFTGIWNLVTGDNDYRVNSWVAGDAYTNYGIITSVFNGHPDIIPIEVQYVNSPFVPTIDLARLTITGYNFNSGVSLILSGQY